MPRFSDPLGLSCTLGAGQRREAAWGEAALPRGTRGLGPGLGAPLTCPVPFDTPCASLSLTASCVGGGALSQGCHCCQPDPPAAPHGPSCLCTSRLGRGSRPLGSEACARQALPPGGGLCPPPPCHPRRDAPCGPPASTWATHPVEGHGFLPLPGPVEKDVPGSLEQLQPQVGVPRVQGCVLCYLWGCADSREAQCSGRSGWPVAPVGTSQPSPGHPGALKPLCTRWTAGYACWGPLPSHAPQALCVGGH